MPKSSVITAIVLSLFVSLLSLSCDEFQGIKGEGPVKEETRALPEFRSVSLSVPAEVTLRQGRQKDIVVEAQQNILEILNTMVENDVLEIKFEENVGSHEKIKVFITVPDYHQVSISGSGSVKSDGQLKGDELDLKISGSGEMNFQARYERVKANISGSGDISLAGRSQFFEVSITGSGEVEALDLKTEQADIKVTGSGEVETEVKERLDVTITGSGDVKYSGHPVVNSRTNGSGSVSSLE